MRTDLQPEPRTYVVRLTPGEEQAILGNPHGLRLLMDHADLQYTMASSVLEPEKIGRWPTARWTALYERGRSIMAEDLDIWDDDIRRAFGFPPSAQSTPQPADPSAHTT